MKIGLLTHSVNPRGGVVHTLELAQALHSSGHAVTVLAPAAPGQSMFRPVAHRLALVAVDSTPTDLHDMVASRIAAFERHLRALPDLDTFDIWHAHDGIGSNALANLVDARLIGGYVRTVHHLDDFEDARVMRWQRRSVERAARVLCVSPLWCRHLHDAHGIIAVLVSNGVDLARYQPVAGPHDAEVAARWGLRPGAPLWLAVGGIEERKNTLRALHAFVQHKQPRPGAQFVIAGGASLLDHGAYQCRFRDGLAASGVADSVVLTGTVPDADMPALFRLADGLLMPSLREGVGLVVLEALASGTPVVVPHEAPFTEYLAADDARWCDPLDPRSIAAAMQHALRRPLNGVPEVCRRYSWQASAQRHIEIYSALCAHA